MLRSIFNRAEPSPEKEQTEYIQYAQEVESIEPVLRRILASRKSAQRQYVPPLSNCKYIWGATQLCAVWFFVVLVVRRDPAGPVLAGLAVESY